MMNVKDLNVKEIENFTSFVKKLLTLLFIYLFRNNNCDNHFVKTAFEINNSKTWKSTTQKIAKFHFLGILENQGDY